MAYRQGDASRMAVFRAQRAVPQKLGVGDVRLGSVVNDQQKREVGLLSQGLDGKTEARQRVGLTEISREESGEDLFFARNSIAPGGAQMEVAGRPGLDQRLASGGSAPGFLGLEGTTGSVASDGRASRPTAAVRCRGAG